jgi:hypothetical protein
MRSFVIACAAVVVIAIVAAVALNSFQRGAEVAFVGDGARI